MKKDITKEILEKQADLKGLIDSIKGLSNYSKHNQELLLKTFDKKNIEKYISMEKNLKKKTYSAMLNGSPVYIKNAGFGLGISRDKNVFQVTNHTLFTFIQEFNLKPIDFSILK